MVLLIILILYAIYFSFNGYRMFGYRWFAFMPRDATIRVYSQRLSGRSIFWRGDYCTCDAISMRVALILTTIIAKVQLLPADTSAPSRRHGISASGDTDCESVRRATSLAYASSTTCSDFVLVSCSKCSRRACNVRCWGILEPPRVNVDHDVQTRGPENVNMLIICDNYTRSLFPHSLLLPISLIFLVVF